ncbi:hypothetical protein [Myroides odoratimimus]|uniref:hypothetical protein n=1 Tax=Myroides odoratimimus TaxID=76832 RepID=UPI002574EC51|nr:hypothetical protein [Myroides odoratimimus]MDM1085864.1 hypothetical protein [Myroides odoratimimus]
MRKASILFLIISLLNSCKAKNEEQIVTVEDKYSLSIPSFLTKVTNLNSDASLQYQHVWKEFYIIVIDESKDEMKTVLEENNMTSFYHNDLDGYSKLLLDSFKGEISNVNQSVVLDTILNGLPAKLTTLTGRVEGIDVFYSIGFYEGKDRYYQVLSWTTSSNKYLYNSKMEKILYSLRELKNKDNVQ